ncbi:MAG: PorT family protein [Cyclobacteriaceae bacterium]|nr:PorT family protein [Cyclobacteriaceae bacterium]
MKKVLLILPALVFCSTLVRAQLVQAHVGASTAINSTFVLDQGLKADPQYVSVTDFQMAPFGFNFGVNFGKKFGLQLESILANYKQVYKIKDKVDQAKEIGEMGFEMKYLHLPMLLKFMNGSDKKARMNFNFGPQLSLLRSGAETLAFGPDAAGQSMAIPDIPIDPLTGEPDMSNLPVGTTFDPASGEYTLPDPFPTDPAAADPKTLLEKGAANKLESFKNQEFHIVGGFGLDVDLSQNIYMSLNVKADYSFTDMRNGDLIDQLQGGSVSDIFGNRSNLAIGAQITVNYMFGGLRSFKKDKGGDK